MKVKGGILVKHRPIIQNAYLGSELLNSSNKNKGITYKVVFAGAVKTECHWTVNFILTLICLSNTPESNCQGASSSNMYINAEPGQIVRFDRSLGINRKETIECSNGNLQLCERFFSVVNIKILEIETDHILYEISI